MPPIVAGALQWLGGALGGLLSALAKWAGYFAAYRLGQRRERQKAAERAAEVKDVQLVEAARPPAHRSGLVERMRRGEL